MRVFTSINEIIDAHKGHFFDAAALRFFGGRVLDDVTPLPEAIGGAYFVTSEKRPRSNDPRGYTIRYATPEGDVKTVGDFQGYSTARRARAAIARELAGVVHGLAEDARDCADADNRCSDCEGRGYTVASTLGVGHAGAELERCDTCQELPDVDIAPRFVTALENGDEYARKLARFLLKNGAPALAQEV